MAALGNLVAGVAHEINTPIGIGVTMASDLLQTAQGAIRQDAAEQLDQSQRNRYWDKFIQGSQLILGNLQRAEDLVNSFKRIAVDQSRESFQDFYLREYLEDVVKSVNSLFREGHHQYKIDCPSEIMLHGSPGSMAQIFTNLITNSIIHGFEDLTGGHIDIRCRLVQKHLSIEFSDNGRGIPKENLTKIFNPFYTTKMGKGGAD